MQHTDRKNHFNPLPPYGGRPPFFIIFLPYPLFQSTPSVWRETVSSQQVPCTAPHFNPLPPYGGRPLFMSRREYKTIFQSTPSVWRETRAVPPDGFFIMHFNPLPPYGGRQQLEVKVEQDRPISIHSLRMEGDAIFSPVSFYFFSFQSTPSVWRETAKLHRKAFFISPILVQSCKKGCKRLHSAPEKMIFFEKREKNSVRNLQHLSVRL